MLTQLQHGDDKQQTTTRPTVEATQLKNDIRIWDLPEVGVRDFVEALSLLTGVRLLRVGAGEGLLAEDGLVAANEGELVLPQNLKEK